MCGAACLEFGAGEMPKSGDVIGLVQPLLFGIWMVKTEGALEKYPDQVSSAHLPVHVSLSLLVGIFRPHPVPHCSFAKLFDSL